jgi:hypothetical protein
LPYDDKVVLQTYKDGTHEYKPDSNTYSPELFSKVSDISSHRNFIFMADDGKVDLGAPTTLEDFAKKDPVNAALFLSKGALYNAEVLQRQSELLVRRSLAKLVPILKGELEVGIGLGKKNLLPEQATCIRKVRSRPPPPLPALFAFVFMALRASFCVCLFLAMRIFFCFILL